MFKDLEQLPNAISQLCKEMANFRKAINDHPYFKDELQDEFLTIEQASDFTSLAKQTIYQLVSKRKIPFVKRKGSKRLYFSKNELREWILSGRKKRK